MSSYGRRFFKEENIERQYYANTLRVNLMALIQRTDEKYPWEYEEWQATYPYLSKFLNEVDSDYGKTEEDYFNIISDFYKLSEKDKWLLESLHESLDKHLKKYVLPKPKSIKSFVPYTAALLIGMFLGWVLF